MRYAPISFTALLGVLFLGSFGLSPAQAQVQTISTDHFRIHYFAGAQGTARRIAEVAEEVFPSLAATYDYYDDFTPIHVIVVDNSDVLGNASADYYSNTIVFWSTNNLDYELRGNHDWVKNTFTHELAHIITLNKARKKWPFQFALFSVSRSDENPDISFSVPLLNINSPRWWAEGVAQYATERLGFEAWDAHRDMLLRMAVLEDDMLSYEEMGSTANRTGKYYGEMVYNQGYALLLYIHDQYGREKVEALTHHIGTLSFDPAIRQTLGISADQLYADWKRYLKTHYQQQAGEIRGDSFFEGEPLHPLNEGILEYFPSYSPDGRKLAYVSSEKRDFAIPYLKIYDLESGRKKTIKEYVDSRISWAPDNSEIVFARNKGGLNDLYVYHIESEKMQRISARLRAKDPAFSPDGQRIAFVRNEDGTNNIGLINRDGTDLVYLTNNNDATQYSAPRWSPDGEWLLFSIFRGEDRDIAIIRADSPPRPKTYGLRKREQVPDSLKVFPDSLAFPAADTSGFRALLSSAADERDPYWLPDGTGFVFASDRSGVFNIYSYDMDSERVEQLTNVIGGAFSPAVSPQGDIVYAGYHAMDYSLYQFKPGFYKQQALFEPVAMRDFQSVFQGPKLSEEFTVGRYSGRNILNFTPIFQIGPTFVGNTFGLNQVSAGVQFSTGDMFGGQDLTAWGVVGKNTREETDLNTDVGFYFERRLRPMVGNNRSFNPSMYVGYRRREIDNMLKSATANADTVQASTLFPIPIDAQTALLIPDAQQYIYEIDSRRDQIKDIYETASVGINMPLTSRQRLTFQYSLRDYDENWSLQRFRQQSKVFIVQDIDGDGQGDIDITSALPEALVAQDTLLVNEDDPQAFYGNLDFYKSNDITLAWSYSKSTPKANQRINPTGRGISLIYRYLQPTLADSLAQLTAPDVTTRDLFGPSKKQFRVNEYIVSYVERIGLPFDNSLSFSAIGAYRNIKLKDSFIEDGGFFEGRFYWPLRYYLGGLNFLSGYPYFARSGSKLAYGRVSYSFPIIQRLNMRFLNFTFSQLYAELFAETGAVGNFDNFDAGNFDRDDFLSDVGAELRLQLFTFYRIPMQAFLQVAHPLDRKALQVNADDPLIDRWRYYFGLGF
ncbi:MAG: hypothetical protein GKR89_08235 [Candidatus Latescibacteria bacterium]|nr:hypothetical protein [Candidatus Latescibacterota bacterium]